MPPYLKNGTAQFAPISNRSRRSHIIVIVKLSYSNLYCMTLVTDDFLSTTLSITLLSLFSVGKGQQNLVCDDRDREI